jgi:hypothetical protein
MYYLEIDNGDLEVWGQPDLRRSTNPRALVAARGVRVVGRVFLRTHDGEWDFQPCLTFKMDYKYIIISSLYPLPVMGCHLL